ncbi:Ig-like domain-containing protein [Telmatobacter sp. DSM 110680]|uniref:Ig-like domain-containing protein n=1 Tax=Telmatobacter sp. DSM 110680 TaxID=3036704 RepID=A0AAU7DPR5_9BACT
MRDRSLFGALLLLAAVVPLTSCSTDPGLTSITLTPNGYSALLGPCGTQQVVANFTAMGSYTRPGHATVTKDITDSVTWYSYDTQLVTMSPTGVMSVVTCANPGSTFQASTIISASAQGFHGLISQTATVSLVEPPVTPAVVSLSIVKTSGTIGSAQYVAVGKTADGTLVPVANHVTWTTDNPQAVRMSGTGFARAIAAGHATVTATYANPDGTTATGSAEFGSLTTN